jgi:putative multiple sugar transport system substrate-binding protein
MKKAFALILALVLTLAFVACGGAPAEEPAPASTAAKDPTPAASTGGDPTPPPAAGDIKVGVSMPTKGLQRWIQDGDNLKSQFEAAGYQVDLQYGGDNIVAEQVAQIENMISSGCQVLVIAAIEASSLTQALAPAIDQGVIVIAYDRLIRNTDAISYYATFDNEEVGRTQGRYIEEALDLPNAAGPFNLEIFTGDPGDTNAAYFYSGAMEIMQPYIDSGKVVVLSGQTTQQQTGTADWNAANAQARMENLISSQGYGPTSGTKLDAVLCSNDSTAQGAITALQASGYDPDTIPVITGQDCDKPNVGFLLEGYEAVSVFKDTRLLADQTVKMVTQILNGETVDVNDTTTYDNGVKVVPSFLCTPIGCTKDMVQSLLFDSGYYSWDDPDFEELREEYGQ